MTHCLSQGYRNRKTNAVKLHRIYDYILFPYFAAQGIRYLLGYLHGINTVGYVYLAKTTRRQVQ